MTLYASKADIATDAVCTAFKKAGIEVVLNYYPPGENECIVDTTEHDKEIKNKAIDEVLQTIRKGMSELLESPRASNHYMCNHDYAVCNTMEIIDDLILKKDIEQMKEGGDNG